MSKQLIKSLIFYFFMFVGPCIVGLYWVFYQNGKPDKAGVVTLVFYCALLGIIRSLQVGVSIIDLNFFNFKAKFQRLKKIWMP